MDSAATVLDTSFWITAGGIVLLLVLSGFFSGSETALTAASRGKLRSQADKGSRGAEVALEVTEDNERLIIYSADYRIRRVRPPPTDELAGRRIGSPARKSHFLI